MNIAVVGAGYVGLTTGACLAEAGHQVICCDVDEAVVATLARGTTHFYEPGLTELVARNLEGGRLRFTSDVAEGVTASHMVFVTVGTPFQEDGSTDVEQVMVAVNDIARTMDGEKIVVLKSTVPIGTALRVRKLLAAQAEHRAYVCSNPEFLREGSAVADFMRPERVVIGVEDEVAVREMRNLYEPFLPSDGQVIVMDTVSAEVLKYSANVMLASRISLMNAVAHLCEEVGADVEKVRLGVGSDSRIGPFFLRAGIGYGGSCLPKDVRALARAMRENGVSASVLVEAIGQVNERQKRRLLEMVVDRFGEDLTDRTFAFWGLSFKPDTDDMREAPSLVTLRGLLERGAKVVAHDPAAMPRAQQMMNGAIECRDGCYDVLRGADALVIHSEWRTYRDPDFAAMRELLKEPIVFDGRNLYRPNEMENRKFEYRSVGRRHVRAAPDAPGRS